MQAKVQTAEIGEARLEAQAEHAINGVCVQVDDLVWRQAAVSCNVVQVRPDVASIAHWNLDGAACNVALRSLLPQRAQVLFQSCIRARGAFRHRPAQQQIAHARHDFQQGQSLSFRFQSCTQLPQALLRGEAWRRVVGGGECAEQGVFADADNSGRGTHGSNL